MRKSRRTEILDAALRVIGTAGVTSVTFESVAEEAGLTKGGLLYHFPTRDDLLYALNEYLAQQWEATIQTHSPQSIDRATARERLAAYVLVSPQAASRAELLLFLETVNEPAMHEPWRAVMQRWAPSVDTSGELSRDEVDMFVARLAADGLWLYESLADHELSPRVRHQIAQRLARMVVGEEPSAPSAIGE